MGGAYIAASFVAWRGTIGGGIVGLLLMMPYSAGLAFPVRQRGAEYPARSAQAVRLRSMLAMTASDSDQGTAHRRHEPGAHEESDRCRDELLPIRGHVYTASRR